MSLFGVFQRHLALDSLSCSVTISLESIQPGASVTRNGKLLMIYYIFSIHLPIAMYIDEYRKTTRSCLYQLMFA